LCAHEPGRVQVTQGRPPNAPQRRDSQESVVRLSLNTKVQDVTRSAITTFYGGERPKPTKTQLVLSFLLAFAEISLARHFFCCFVLLLVHSFIHSFIFSYSTFLLAFAEISQACHFFLSFIPSFIHLFPFTVPSYSLLLKFL
jgi:hypothetical protein